MTNINLKNRIIEFYKLCRQGLIAEDTALSSRSNILLTFYSLLAIAFVGILQKGFDPYWRSILIISIPALAVILNIIWLWLGCRTLLSFKFHFGRVEKIEEELSLPFFNYATKRREFWKKHKKNEKNKRSWTSIISYQGATHKIFCFYVPIITFAIWGTLLVVVIERNFRFIYCCMGTFVLLLIGFLFFRIFLKIEEIGKETPKEDC
jgi:hypothetical protein